MTDAEVTIATWPTELHRRLGEEILIRDAETGWTRQATTEPLHLLPAKLTPTHHWSIATERASDHTARVRYITQRQWPITHSELARAWLHECMAAGGRHKWLCGPRSVPIEAMPTYCLGRGEPPSGVFAYVDITACFWSLYGSTALNLTFDPRGQVTLPTPRSRGIWPLHRSEWGAWKGPRNAAWGSFWPHPHYWAWSGHRQILRACKGSSTLANSSIIAWVIDILHAVATEAIDDFGARAWLTDAAILPSSRAEEWIEHLANRWALPSRVLAAGDSYIWSMGNYAVGDRISRLVAAEMDGHHRLGPPIRGIGTDRVCHFPQARRNWLARMRHVLADAVEAQECS